MSVKLFKISSGEFIISEANDDIPVMILTSPMCISFGQSEEGKMGISMFPLNPFDDLKTTIIPLHRSNIIFEVKSVPNDFVQIYLKKTSGIVLTNKPMTKLNLPT